MRISRGFCAILALVPLVISGCTGGSGTKGTLSSSAVGPISTATQISTSSTPTTTRATRSSAATSKGSVPVDQIPPGHPTHWVPAGMPTAAKYKEPGDVLPMFTPGFFEKDPSAPGGVVVFVLQALNWAAATGQFSVALSAVCGSQICSSSAAVLKTAVSAHEHISGARLEPGNVVKTRVAPIGSKELYVVRMHLTTSAGRIVAASGGTVRTIRKAASTIDFFMSWSGKMWHVSRDALVSIG